MKKIYCSIILISLFFIFAAPAEAISVDDILNEYKKEYADWKKEQQIQKIVDKLVAQYPEKNKKNQRIIAREFLVKFDEETAKTALEVSRNESGFRSDAAGFNTNGTWDKGCWQINDIHKLSDSVRFNCKKSTEWAAKKVERDGGFGAWVAYWTHVAPKKS